MDLKKKNVSVRLNNSDIKRLREISSRLGVKESDLFRFSVKTMLGKLMPLHDKEIKGVDLIPALMECGEDLTRFFEMDADDLYEIINAGIDSPDQEVSAEDLDLLVLSTVNGQYVLRKLSDMLNTKVEREGAHEALKEYLSAKYLCRRQGDDGFHGKDSGSLIGTIKRSVQEADLNFAL